MVNQEIHHVLNECKTEASYYAFIKKLSAGITCYGGRYFCFLPGEHEIFEGSLTFHELTSHAATLSLTNNQVGDALLQLNQKGDALLDEGCLLVRLFRLIGHFFARLFGVRADHTQVIAKLRVVETPENPTTSKTTKLLCVLFDAGETAALLPVLKELEEAQKDFQLVVMGTAETLIKPEAFPGRRITLKDLQIDTVIDATTARTISLSAEMMRKFQVIHPKVVLVGVASRIQQQVLEQFPDATTVAFVDMFSYDTKVESFATVAKVQAAAKRVFVPSEQTCSFFTDLQDRSSSQPSYYVTAKPSLKAWEKEINSVDRKQILKTLNFTEDKPIVTLIGGYGAGYEVVNPLFVTLEKTLQERGFQVIQQPHPKIAPQKVKTTEALAVSKYVVGYNSSVVLDSAIVGIDSLFFIPDDPKTQFQHFAIDKGLIAKVSTEEELLKYLMSSTTRKGDLQAAMGLPRKEDRTVIQYLNQWMQE